MSATWENFSQISKSDYVSYCNKYGWNVGNTVRNDMEIQNQDGIFEKKWTEEEIDSIVNEMVEYSTQAQS